MTTTPHLAILEVMKKGGQIAHGWHDQDGMTGDNQTSYNQPEPLMNEKIREETFMKAVDLACKEFDKPTVKDVERIYVQLRLDQESRPDNAGAVTVH
ncbi:MAG: hypothetical protein KA735_04740 [Burkholderiaceae bacterium]|nr:hypothetical protein [Burkholderiaceae bacterium]